MARVIDDATHHLTEAFVSRKYTTHADSRQRAMGLEYVTAEKQDLVSEIAAFVRRMREAAPDEGVAPASGRCPYTLDMGV
ncbi:hypothetical protein D3C86_2016540 [compost metagenome]